eukprot:2370438-Alexandrium_andersonii.AAC.1
MCIRDRVCKEEQVCSLAPVPRHAALACICQDEDLRSQQVELAGPYVHGLRLEPPDHPIDLQIALARRLGDPLLDLGHSVGDLRIGLGRP